MTETIARNLSRVRAYLPIAPALPRDGQVPQYQVTSLRQLSGESRIHPLDLGLGLKMDGCVPQ